MREQDQSGITEDELESLTTDDKRWKDVGKQFAAMNIRLSNQDVVIESTAAAVKQIAEDTKAMRDAWNDGVAVKRFFCRLAEAWKFMLKQVLFPFGVPLLALYGIWYYSQFHRFPTWLGDCFKFLMAVL